MDPDAMTTQPATGAQTFAPRMVTQPGGIDAMTVTLLIAMIVIAVTGGLFVIQRNRLKRFRERFGKTLIDFESDDWQRYQRRWETIQRDLVAPPKTVIKETNRLPVPE